MTRAPVSDIIASHRHLKPGPRSDSAVTTRASSMTIDPSVVAAFTPPGKLRASINLGNTILANKNAETGEPFGVSIDLARAFATKLGVELELVVFDAAGKSVQAVSEERADFGFFAVDPLRGETIAFTAPYV